MSTIKSSAEDLTLNADGSGNDIIFQSNGSNVATLDQAGLLTATTFAGSGASLTALNATNLGSGTVPTARLGSGTASSSTVLYGDQTYKAEPTGGKILQVVTDQSTGQESTTSVSFVTYDTASVTITPATTSSRILLLMTVGRIMVNSRIYIDFQRAISGGTTTTGITGETYGLGYWEGGGTSVRQVGTLTTVDSPSTTSAITYKLCYHTNDFQEAFIGYADTETSITAIEIGA